MNAGRLLLFATTATALAACALVADIVELHAPRDAKDGATSPLVFVKSDVIAPAPLEVPTPDVACAGRVNPGKCVPPAGNVAHCADARASSEYPDYPASHVNDGVVTTSWYAADGACPEGGCLGSSTFVDLELSAPRTIGRVKIVGNRDSPSNYDVLMARIRLADAAGAVLHEADVSTARGPEPDGDVEHVFAAVTCVANIRVTVLTSESSAPGIAEIEAYEN